MTTVEIPDYELQFATAIRTFWEIREHQAAKQLSTGKVDAGTRGQVTGGKQFHAVAKLIGQVMVKAGFGPPGEVVLPGYYRRSKRWDVVAMYGSSLGAVVELKGHIGSMGNNANNRIEEMIGQSVDFWKANRADLLGDVAPWFGYLMLVEDSAASRRKAPKPSKPTIFPADPIFTGTDYIERYAIALDRLRQERDMDQVCLVASSKDGKLWYPDPTMTFQIFATTLHARGLTLRTQLGDHTVPQGDSDRGSSEEMFSSVDLGVHEDPPS